MNDKPKTYCLWKNGPQHVRNNLINVINDLDLNIDWEVKISKLQKDKTRKQLGALFGLWIKEEADRMGESEDCIHHKWKNMFLARIYTIEPMSPEQEMWVDLLAYFSDLGEYSKLQTHATRISLSWAKLPQVKEYMKAIEQHFMAEGRPLTVPDPYYKAMGRS